MNLIWIKSENYKFVKIDVLKIKSIESVKYTAKIRRLDITTYDGELIRYLKNVEIINSIYTRLLLSLLKTLWKLEISKQRVKIFRKA